MLYALARPLLFALDPEVSHRLTLKFAGLARFSLTSVSKLPVKAMGLEFPNPVGLAAGLDKDAAHIDALAGLGFGFIEVGTVTPRPQPGNARPRLFRLPQAGALINRFGFNNVGVDAFLANRLRARWPGIVGINIGKNADTPAERAIDDFALCFEKVYAHASYVTVNVSSPNTRNLRDLQQEGQLNALLARLVSLREKLKDAKGKNIPLALKVAPDLEEAQVHSIADAVRRHRIDAVIATNTSLSREGVEGLRHAAEAGGLSGAPIKRRATTVLQKLKTRLKNEVVLIGSGGIGSGQDAAEKLAAGASLVQLYTGLIYRGPRLVAECIDAASSR